MKPIEIEKVWENDFSEAADKLMDDVVDAIKKEEELS